MVIKWLDIEIDGILSLDWGAWGFGPLVIVRKAEYRRGLDCVTLGFQLGPLDARAFFWHWRG